MDFAPLKQMCDGHVDQRCAEHDVAAQSQMRHSPAMVTTI
jgi:hypothetical protein